MIDRIIDALLKAVFSVPSLLVHGLFLVWQLVFHVNQNLVTNLISWEAIFLAVMIGIQQLRHHDDHMDAVQDILKNVDKKPEDSDNKGGA